MSKVSPFDDVLAALPLVQEAVRQDILERIGAGEHIGGSDIDKARTALRSRAARKTPGNPGQQKSAA